MKSRLHSHMVNKRFLIGAGGFIGSVLRYIIGGSGPTLNQSIAFPYGPLTINFLLEVTHASCRRLSTPNIRR